MNDGSLGLHLDLEQIKTHPVSEEQVRAAGVGAAKYALDNGLSRQELSELLSMIGVS